MCTAVKERPILFSGEMVRAILNGRKTQTRRVVKPQPEYHVDAGIMETYPRVCGPEWFEPVVIDRHGEEQPGEEVFGIYSEDGEYGCKCPYPPGTRLWVRETWLELDKEHWWDSSQPKEATYLTGEHWGERKNGIAYRASTDTEGDDIRREYGYKWRPSIFMPRWASRITLEVTEVRVEKLNSISEEDARAEGIVTKWLQRGKDGELSEWCDRYGNTAIKLFRELWDSINGKKHPWESNPWVWAYTFKRTEDTL